MSHQLELVNAMNVNQVQFIECYKLHDKIRIRTHAPHGVDEAEFTSIEDAINYLTSHKWRK